MLDSWSRRDETVAERALWAPVTFLSWLYGAAAALHREAYARGLLSQRRLACQVVSVGGIVAGGSGKTPAAAWLARALRRRGHRIAIASRGYGREAREPVQVVSDGTRVLLSPREAGDEPVLLAAHARGVPVLVARDRGLAGLRAIAAFGSDVLLLDDGFQHHRLARDVDLVTLDGGLGLGNGQVLPRGPLREPPRALARADAILVIDGPLHPLDEARLRRHAPRVPRFQARRRATGLRPLAGGPALPVETLAGAEVGIVAGIAQPASLRRSLEALGARVVAEHAFPDHHRFRPGDLDRLERHVPVWVTTEKDAVRLPATWTGGADVRVLASELVVEDETALLDFLEPRLRGGRRERRV